MIKAAGEKGGRPALVLGLSHANLDRLRAGSPISFDAKPYGFDGTIMIFAGTDEAAMAEVLMEANPGIIKHEEPNAP